MSAENYRYSNSQYFEMSHEEILAQEKILEPLREKHTAELFNSGAAMRIRLATIALNGSSYRNDTNFTEGTTLYACRYGIDSINRASGVNIGVGLGHAVSTFNFGDDPEDWSAIMNKPLAYAAGMGRIDSYEKKRHRNRYVPAGILTITNTAQGLNVEPLIPAKGVKRSDLDLLIQQMEETWDFAEEKQLTIVDPCTAEDGYGEIEPIL